VETFFRADRPEGGLSVKEASSVKVYPPVFKSAGTEAALYTRTVENFVKEFQDFFKNEPAMLLGYDTPLTVTLGMYYPQTL
jgi:hypothetical protein